MSAAHMTHGLLDQAKARLEDARRTLDRASEALIADDLAGVARLLAPIVADLSLTDVPFKADHQALDLVAGHISVALSWAEAKQLDPPARLRRLLNQALATRVAWLRGEDPA